MSELRHFGILGMKWGVRRYQESDGDLTSAGKRRYSDKPKKKNSEASRLASARARLTKKDKKELESYTANDKHKVLNTMGRNKNRTFAQAKAITLGKTAIKSALAVTATVLIADQVLGRGTIRKAVGRQLSNSELLKRTKRKAVRGISSLLKTPLPTSWG